MLTVESLLAGADVGRGGLGGFFLKEARQVRRVIEAELIGRFGNG